MPNGTEMTERCQTRGPPISPTGKALFVPNSIARMGAMTMPRETWLHTLMAGLRALRNPSTFLASPDDAVALAELLDARQAIGVSDSDGLPSREAGKRLASNLSENWRLNLIDMVELAVKSLDAAISQRLDNGMADSRVLRTSDFQGIRVLPTGLQTVQGHAIVEHAAPLDPLPTDHAARLLVPNDDCLRIDGKPALVLHASPVNSSGGAGPCPKFALVQNVVVLTRRARLRQIEKERLDAERDNREERSDANWTFGTARLVSI